MPQSPKSEDDEFEAVNPRKVPKNRARKDLTLSPLPVSSFVG